MKSSLQNLISIKKLVLIFCLASMVMFETNAQVTLTGNPQCLPGFTDELVSNGWDDLRQVTFDSIGRMYVVEGQGKVFILDTNNVKQMTPLIDISEEVGWWNAHGLLSLALDKDFLANGYFYLYYTVDRHYLMNYGTPNYNSFVDDYHTATINRVTRYQADSSTNFTTVIPGSRHILLGTDKKNGIPVLYNNHDGGHIVMSPDGSLVISTGDSGHGGAVDTGYNSQTYYAQALIDTIILPEENVGALRSQQKQSASGKILRIDPITGLGLPSNPYYDVAYPESYQSRVWSLGLRNPFRFSIRPNTWAANNMSAGQPGALFVSQVGFHTWEDIYVANGSGKNFGWPIYEGMFPHPDFSVTQIENMYAPNPLYGTGGCTNQYFRFIDLLINATLDSSPSWPNPCDSVGSQIPLEYQLMRTRPVLSWHHVQPLTYVPGFMANDPIEYEVGAVGSPATGPLLFGNCSAGSEWYSGTAYPQEFRNKFFYEEFGDGYIAMADVDSNNNITAIDTFATHLGNPIGIDYNKRDQCLYYIEYPYEIHRIRYTFGLNLAPKAIATQDKLYGPGPFLTVNFNGQQSNDPEYGPLTYSWNFGDGNTSTLVSPQNIYNPPTSNPTKYDGTLTVTDTGGLSGIAHFIVSANNTPPVVQITSPVNGSYYSNVVSQIWNLTATVTDAEHDSSQLHWSWYTSLHHNFHEHPNPVDTDISPYIVTDPEDCIDNYYFEITLTVTDDGGLSTTQSVFIYQDCPLNALFSSDMISVCRGDSVHYYENIVGHADSVYWIFQNGSPATSKLFNPAVAYKNGYGARDVTLIAYKSSNSDTLFADNYMFIKNSPSFSQNVTGNITTCVDSSVQLSVIDTTIYGYLWYKNGAPLANDTLSSYLVQTSGIYYVKVTQLGNSCYKLSVPLDYEEHNISNVLTLSGPSSLCNTDSVVLTTDFDYAYIYQWFKNGTLIPGAASNSYTAYQTGNYNAFVTDGGACSVTSNVVNVVKTPESEIVFTTDSIICPAGDVVIMDANVAAGLSYQWYQDGVLINGATSSTYSAINAGQYSVLVSDGSGCSHLSNSLIVTDCTGIENHSLNEMFSIFPNPVQNTLNIKLSFAGATTIQIKVLDVVGKLMISKSLVNQAGNYLLELKTNNLPQGVYQMLIESDRFSEVKRFVKY